MTHLMGKRVRSCPELASASCNRRTRPWNTSSAVVKAMYVVKKMSLYSTAFVMSEGRSPSGKMEGKKPFHVLETSAISWSMRPFKVAASMEPSLACNTSNCLLDATDSRVPGDLEALESILSAGKDLLSIGIGACLGNPRFLTMFPERTGTGNCGILDVVCLPTEYSRLSKMACSSAVTSDKRSIGSESNTAMTPSSLPVSISGRVGAFELTRDEDKLSCD